MSTDQKLRELVAEGKTKKALDMLVEVSESLDEKDVRNQAIALKSRFNNLKRNLNQSIITSENANLESNRIHMALLSLLDDLPESNTPPETTAAAPASSPDAVLTLEMVNEMEMNEVMSRIQTLMNKRKLFQDELDIASDASQKFNLSENIKKITAEIEMLKERLS